jgi:hypothetical protein
MKIHWLAFATLISLSACKSQKEGLVKMSSTDETKIIHCVGRTLISLPSSFVESYITTGIFKSEEEGAQGHSFDVVVRNGVSTVERFATEVQMRRTKLKELEDGSLNILRLDQKIDERTNLFRVQQIDDAYISEVYVMLGSNVVAIRLESYHDTYLKAEEALVKLVKQMDVSSINSPDKKTSGFCLGGINLAGKFNLESGSFLFRDGTGASFDIDINSYALDDEKPLLKRMSDPDSLLTVFNVNHKVFRARERTVAGMRAQEWLGSAKISDDPEAKTLKFTLGTMRAKPGRTAPSINLEFDTAQPLEDGTQTKTHISDDEAIRQWDAVVDSIRPAGV